MALERRIAKGRYCQRECGRRLLASSHNIRSGRDDKQICADCYVDELYENFKGER